MESWEQLLDNQKFLVAVEKKIIHTKPFFFPVVSAAICTDHLLEVDQSVDTLSQYSPEGVLGKSLVSTLPELVSTHCPSTAQKATSVDTTWASVDTLSQVAQKVFWELSLVSTLPDPVSTLLDQFFMFLLCV
ncbi:hypothetical protein Taro_055169 [Colocasia esculenta]|uniref:Uncharacterized protein n=1 Tax=Colocasia esculenta TaxID=4460 RepID=A0A843XSU0_COLES|nr:hypothetical protein [Colocasia esculenta]